MQTYYDKGRKSAVSGLFTARERLYSVLWSMPRPQAHARVANGRTLDMNWEKDYNSATQPRSH